MTYRMQRSAVVGVIFSAVALTSTVSRAETVEPEPKPPQAASAPPVAPPKDAPAVERRETRWYGWQTLLADAGSIGLVVAGASVQSSAIVLGGVGTYALAPATIHIANGNPGRGAASLGMRVVLPPLHGLVGMKLGAGDDKGIDGALGGALGFLAGFTVGIAACIVMDSAWLARDEVAPKTAASPPKPQVVPTVTADANKGMVGVGGTF